MPADLLSAAAGKYLDELVPERPAELRAMEDYAREHRFPIIGPACGHLCYLLTRLTGARRVFELGSGYGYSTAWFAKAVQENGGGVVHHVVWDEKLSQMARTHLSKLGYDGLVQYHVGEAVAALTEQTGQFDIIFCDIDKQGYPDALPVVETHLRTGGLLLTDNMLWHGRLFDDVDQEPATQGIRRMTELVYRSPRWNASLVPIRDGLMVAQRC